MNASLVFSEACERNKQPILEALRAVLPARGCVLEIGSGTGQHVVHFARFLPGLDWQPSDRPDGLPDLRRRLRAEGGQNIRPPLELDVGGIWPAGPFEAAYSANTAHIMSWPEVCQMFAGVGRVLVPAGVFCLYGPFNEIGAFTAPSNAAFDRQLRQQDPSMGLRDVAELETLARDQQMALAKRFEMPANNQLLVFSAVAATETDTGANPEGRER